MVSRCPAAVLLALLVALAAAEPAHTRQALRQPLAYGKDLVEVRQDSTLGRRYRHWGDWQAEFQDYLREARANAASRPTPPRLLRLGCVFLKNARVTFPAIKGAEGKPLEATYDTQAEFQDRMRRQATGEYSDFMFAFSGGLVKVEWVFETVEGIHWIQEGDKPNWGCQPKAAGPQLERALGQHKGKDVCMWVFCAGRPTTQNAATPKQHVQGIGGGISYTQWKLIGGYSLVTSVPDLGFLVHEFNHRYLDNLEAIEGIRLTQFHGLARLGYEPDDLGYPHLLNTYRSVYLYIVRPDMWRRFTVTGANRTAREPFSGKSYRWDDVKADCWFKLPELHDAELAKLTGLASFKMDATKDADYRLYTVADADRAQVLSPYVAAGGERDTALNNLLSLHTESCAIVKTATGNWLFVRPDLADLYVDMRKVSGAGADALPAHGYVLEGIRPLLVLRAPPEMALPTSELGFFRSGGAR